MQLPGRAVAVSAMAALGMVGAGLEAWLDFGALTSGVPNGATAAMIAGPPHWAAGGIG
ncbi:MAG TPA: hypothetical protein VNF75_08645 [Candidatus Dormibacteraeota bacterium]|nr:hypothetical protein [Candidatus Dormibacteraeota bacterium]